MYITIIKYDSDLTFLRPTTKLFYVYFCLTTLATGLSLLAVTKI